MQIESAIQQSFSQGKILVFPKEVSARSNLIGYVKSQKKAIFADRALSWDTFKDMFTEKPADKKCATDIERLLFVRQFFKTEQAKTLRHFFNSNYPQSRSAFVKNTVKNLASFKRAVEHKASYSQTICQDIQIIYDSYCKFLDSNGLYQREYLKLDFSKADKNRYVLVFPSAVTDPDIEIAVKHGFHTIDLDNQTQCNFLNVYENSLAEIRATVRTVFELLKTVNSCDISITLNDFDNYYPYLFSECSKRGIELSPSYGKKLQQYNAGIFFTGLKALYQSDFDIENLKALLLNPVYPFKDRQTIQNLIKILIEQRVQNFGKNLSKINYKLSKLQNIEKEKKFVSDLHQSIKGLCTSVDAQQFRKAFHYLQDNLLDGQSWHTVKDEIQKNAFERAMVIVDDIERAQNECSVEAQDFYTLFLEMLSMTTYTANTKKNGIKVYSFPASAAIKSDFSFVLGLSDSQIKIKRQYLPFADDQLSTDVSSAVLGSYSYLSSTKTFLSCSLDSFSTQSNAPAFFVEKDIVRNVKTEPNDSFIDEEEMWIGKDNASQCLETQKQWFLVIKDNLIKNTLKASFFPIALPVNLSATQISEFSKCPYKWLCFSIYNIKEQDFEVDMKAHLQIGSVLHEVYEEFFSTVKDFNSFTLQKNRQLLLDIFDDKMTQYSKQCEAIDLIHLKDTILFFRQKILSVVDATGSDLFADTVYDSSERRFELKYKDCIFRGYIDVIMKDNDNNYAVIDFKKNTVDKKSFQVVLYAKMLENDPHYNAVPTKGAFYSIQEQKYYSAWDNVQEYNQRVQSFEELKDRLIECVKQSDFTPTPSEDNCQNCSYSRLCRKRFVIK